MQIYDIAQVQANPSAIFHQADTDSVFVEFDGNRYEIRQVVTPLTSALNVAGLSAFHEKQRSQPQMSIDDILDDIAAGRERR